MLFRLGGNPESYFDVVAEEDDHDDMDDETLSNCWPIDDNDDDDGDGEACLRWAFVKYGFDWINTPSQVILIVVTIL